MALSKRVKNNDYTDLEMPERPVSLGPVDLAQAEIGAHHYLEPEVNRLKEWAMRAKSEIAKDTALEAQVAALPYGIAIPLLVVASLGLWALIVGVLALTF